MFLYFLPGKSQTTVSGDTYEEFPVVAPQTGIHRQQLLLKTNLFPWLLTIPNIGAEVAIANKWSAALNIMYCPWKMSKRFSVKTAAILPEIRWWLKDNTRGSFFNLHLNLAWFNIRCNDYRYQDTSRPLLGAGLGYGYRLQFGNRWGLEFEIGAGMFNTKYDRYYNIANGALKDTRVTTYWGIDRAAVTLTYYLCDL